MTKSKKLAEVFHFALYGKRDFKYDFLKKNKMDSIQWTKLDYKTPDYYFIKENWKIKKNYNTYINVFEIFIKKGPGVETGLDNFFISFTMNDIKNKINEVVIDERFDKYEIFNRKSYKLRDRLRTENVDNITYYKYDYRTFDQRVICYLKNSLRRSDYDIFKNVIENNNLNLIFRRTATNITGWQHISISNKILDKNYLSAQTYAFPLYLYPDETEGEMQFAQKRKPNLNMEIVEQIAEKIALEFVDEKENPNPQTPTPKPLNFAPIDLLDYIYGVLHSPNYRETFKEFLKIDFPRVPYPEHAEEFWAFAKLGSELRLYHLMEHKNIDNFITSYSVSGDNKVEKPTYKDGKVYINKEQYFDNIPEVAWNFYIGGYQPAQKWLKDRKDRTLSYEDIRHYQRIIVALTETDRLMKEIDKLKKF